ncbi:MAG: hypothetical protein EXS17_05720 [Phycisphaerales bacterium]|nr:hypothetical protein [Phycisphaerales bacterium]
MRSFITRFLTPLLLLSTAIAWVRGGTQWAPSWLINVGGRNSLDASVTAQLTVGILCAAALSLLFFGGRPGIGRFIARTALLSFAFCCVATIASLVAAPTSAGSQLWPLAYPAAGLVLCVWSYSVVNRPTTEVAPARRGGVWLGAAVLALWVLSIGIAVRIPIQNNAPARAGSAMNGETVLLDYVQWQGRTLPDTGLSRLLPSLTALTLEGRSIIVLYSPECGHCREVFEEYFASARENVKVIAVEIPPAPGTVQLAGDNLGPIHCAGCERLSLPAGKTYILKPPTVVVIEDGRVVCATDSDWKACLGAAATLSAPTP